MGARELKAIVRRRLAAQSIAPAVHARPADVVAHLGAVQAQDYLGALWAVGLRMKQATEADVERALAEREIVRTWPLRGTLHFVAAADARWMTDLLAPKQAKAATTRQLQFGIDGAVIMRARRVVEKHLEGGRRLTRPQLYAVLDRAKISTRMGRGLQLVWRLAHDGLICFGPREGKQQTFVLLHEWVPDTRALPRDEALGELAARYFTGHGPAALGDFAWWSGLTRTEARRAIEIAGARVVAETIAGEPSWSGRDAPALAPAAATRLHLLPPFDEFLVGYADRSAAVAAEHSLFVNAGGGILNAAIVADDRVIGTWKRTLTRREVALAPASFEPLSRAHDKGIAAAFERYARFLGLRTATAGRPSPAAGTATPSRGRRRDR